MDSVADDMLAERHSRPYYPADNFAHLKNVATDVSCISSHKNQALNGNHGNM
jgi:hypothetical protein